MIRPHDTRDHAMNLGFLMIILTLAGEGQYSAAFVNTATLEECERRAAAVRAILENGNTPIAAMVCRTAEATFQPFAHGGDASAPRHAYVVSYDEHTATVAKVAACGEATPSRPGHYCATSTQDLLPAPH